MVDRRGHMPVQNQEWAVWVKVDDGIGWRIVHESGIKASCDKIAALHILKQYPVVAVDIRGPDHETHKVYSFEGEATS